MALPLFFETRAHVLVCTGPRCGQAGARSLFQRAWAEAERRRLAYYVRGGSVRLTESGCLGACAHGPNAVVYRGDESGALSEAWFCDLDDTRLLALLEALQSGAPLPTEGRYDTR